MNQTRCAHRIYDFNSHIGRSPVPWMSLSPASSSWEKAHHRCGWAFSDWSRSGSLAWRSSRH